MALAVATLTPVSLSDSCTLIPQSGYSISSPFARLILSTESTTFRITLFSSTKGNYPEISKIGIFINGVFFNNFDPPSDGEHKLYLGLDKGPKIIQFISGIQTFPVGQSLFGTYIVDITANKLMTQIIDQPTADRLVIYGDSIAVGDGTLTAVHQNAWAMKVRAGFNGSTALEAWGSRSLKQDFDTDPTFNALVARFVQLNPTKIWLGIGTNDYGLNKWSATSMATAYTILLDAIHTALPICRIFVATPLVRNNEAANSFGNTLNNYRTAISDACSGKDWTTLIDGSTIMTLSDLADGVHPNSVGHGKLAAAALIALG